MCNFASFFVNRETLELAVAGLVHHELDAKTLGIHREDQNPPCRWSECEWTADDSGASLVVRTEDASGNAIKRHILATYPTRADFLRWAIPVAEKLGNHIVMSQADADALVLPSGSHDNIVVGCGGPITLPHVVGAGDIDARSATSLSLPVLTRSGHIDAGSASSLSLPALTTCAGHIYARSAS